MSRFIFSNTLAGLLVHVGLIYDHGVVRGVDGQGQCALCVNLKIKSPENLVLYNMHVPGPFVLLCFCRKSLFYSEFVKRWCGPFQGSDRAVVCLLTSSAAWYRAFYCT